MEDDTGSSRRPPRSLWGHVGRSSVTSVVYTVLFWLAAVGLLVLVSDFGQAAVDTAVHAPADAVEAPTALAAESWRAHLADVVGDYFPVHVIAGFCLLLGLSAFFSSSEIAFFNLTRWKLRSMQAEGTVMGRLVAQLMAHPGKFLSTVLVGNTIVNVLIGILLGTRVESAFEQFLRGLHPVRVAGDVHSATAYLAAVAFTTTLLVFFGEILPKVFAVRISHTYVRLAVLPMLLAERVLDPIAKAVLWITNGIFHLTRFHRITAAPFITDEEFKAVLSQGKAHGVIDEDERQMIQGILEFRDVILREILVPRPDVVALPETATVADALGLLRKESYSRVPIYRDDLDHITGVLFMKDLLPSFAKGDVAASIQELARPPYFVPEIMSVKRFVEDIQRQRVHLAVVVDEYGGTAGIVTLHDAIEEVVGDILDPSDEEERVLEKLSETDYRFDGSVSIDEFTELTGIALEDEEHETVAGFLMDLSEKVLEPGDVIAHTGAVFTVESMDGKRVQTLRVHIAPPTREENPS